MVIEFNNITKRYGKQYALKNVDLKLENGVYGLLGVNGAGKTTLLNIFMGIIKADEGNIYLDGKNVSVLGKEFLGKIGYLPQYPQFYKEFTVYEFMDYMCALKGIDKHKSRVRIDKLLSKVNLSDSMHKRVGALSGGMRQRLGIAQAIINEPEILILDEPTAGLDPRERIRFRNLIAGISEDRAVILATHIVSDIEYIANRVIIMNHGEILCEGTIEELENSLDGKVWELCCRDAGKILEMDSCIVSNMRLNGKITELRIISESRPDSDAVVKGANLDDVFLYYCKGEI